MYTNMFGDALLLTVFGPDQKIRLCDFHIAQALHRWIGPDPEGEASGARPTLALRKRIALEFNKVKAATSVQHFLQLCHTFFTQVAKWCRSRGQFEAIFDYFQTYWFCDEWLRMIICILLITLSATIAHRILFCILLCSVLC